MFPTRKAISYVSNRQKLQEYSCSICYNISLDIFQCQGPCQKYYCISCLDKIPSNRRRCNYCSTDSPFQWKQVIVDNLEFICPYTLTKHAKIGSFSQLQQHCHICPQRESEELKVAQYTQNYQCHEGHDLIFMSESISRKIFKGRSFFTALTNSPCEICKQSTLCRSYCPKCSEQRKKQVLYCTKCRFVPATRTCCPIGHNLQQRNYRSVSSVCDFCGFSDNFSKKAPFSDTTCNFDICYRCYKKLPNQNKLQPLKNEFIPFEDNIVVQPTNTNVLDWRMRFDHHQQQE